MARRPKFAKPRKLDLLPAMIFAVLGILAYSYVTGGGSSSNSKIRGLAHPRTLDQATLAAFSWVGDRSLNADPATLTIDEDRLRRNFVLAIDASGSMAENDGCAPPGEWKFNAVRGAVEALLSGMGPEDNVALIAFQGEDANVLAPLGPGRHDQLNEQLYKVQPGGGTPIGKTLEVAGQLLEAQAQRQAGYGEYNIVIVTDGIASDPDYMNRMLDHLTTTTPIVIQTVGFCIKGNHPLNDPSRVVYRSADDAEALRRGLASVLAEASDFDTAGFEKLN
jgi:Ca-activated chloride channel homolog